MRGLTLLLSLTFVKGAAAAHEAAENVTGFPLFRVPAALGATRAAETTLASLSLSLSLSVLRFRSTLFAFHLTRIRGSPVPCNWTAPCISGYKLAYFRARRDVQWQCRLVSLAVTWIRSAAAVAASPHYLIDSSLIKAALRLFDFTEASYACVVHCQPIKRTSRTMRRNEADVPVPAKSTLESVSKYV